MSGVRRARKTSCSKASKRDRREKTLKNPGRWTRRVFVFTRSPCGMARPVELGGGAPRDGPGCTREDGKKTNDLLVARVPLVFPVVRHGAVAATPGVAPRGAARSDRRVASPVRPAARRGRRRAGGAEPAAAMPWCMNPKNCLAACSAAAAGSCVPRRTPPATLGRAGVASRRPRGADALGAAGAEGAAADPGVGAVNAPPDPPTEGGPMAAPRAPRRTLVPRSRARAACQEENASSQALKSLQTSRAPDARASRLAHPARSSLPETSVPVLRSARRARRAG